MKKYFLIILVTAFLSAKAIGVTTLIPITSSLINEIGEPYVSSTSLIKFNGSFASSPVDDYKVMPNDIRALRKTIFMSFEVFKRMNNINKLFNKNAILLDKNISYIKEGGEINPHIFVSIVNLKIIALNIKNELVKMDKKHANEFTHNYKLVIKNLNNLDKKLKSGFEKGVISSFHNAFVYLSRDYNMRYFYLDNESGSFSLKALKSFQKKIKEEHIAHVIEIKEEQKKHNQILANKLGIKMNKVSVLDKNYKRLFENLQQSVD